MKSAQPLRHRRVFLRYVFALLLVFVVVAMMAAVVSSPFERYRVAWQLESSTYGLTVSRYRPTGLRRLQALLQKSFQSVQHPKDCQTAKFLICDLGNGGVGFGARVHEVVFCHFQAYSLRRVLMLRNAYFDGLQDFIDVNFSPCPVPVHEREVDIQSPGLFNSTFDFNNSARVVSYRHVWADKSGLLPRFIPGSVPLRIAELVQRSGADPGLWYVCQSTHFLVGTIKEQFWKQLDDLQRSLGITRPYVGVHIRHGDKVIWEAKFIPESSYASVVDEYFKNSHPNVTTKHVFLASDDPQALQKLRNHTGSDYRFVSRTGVTQDAASSPHAGVYKRSSLEGLLSDLLLLANADYVVCTFSSNIGRLIHELRQAVFLGADDMPLHDHARSMDDAWLYSCPGYGYTHVNVTTVVAKRDVQPSENSRDRHFIALLKHRWYKVTTESVNACGLIYRVLWPNEGHVLASDVIVFPLRTQVTDPGLDDEITAAQDAGLL